MIIRSWTNSHGCLLMLVLNGGVKQLEGGGRVLTLVWRGYRISVTNTSRVGDAAVMGR